MPVDLKLAGKFIVCYIPACREKEYYLGCACQELYAPPSAYFALYGLSVQTSFLGGKLIFLILFKKTSIVNCMFIDMWITINNFLMN